jgi:hypothetical protein
MKHFVGDTLILNAYGFQDNFAEFLLYWSCRSCSDELLCQQFIDNFILSVRPPVFELVSVT